MIQMDASRRMVEWPFPRDKSAISPKTVSDGENILPRIYKKIISRDTKQRFWESSKICYLFFSTNYFSTPPGVCQNQKKSFTLSAKNPNWRREWDSNPRGRDAQRLSCQSTNIQRGSRGRRFNHSAIPAQQPTKTGTSLKPFPASNGIVRSTRAGRQGVLDKRQSSLKARILPLNPPRENVIHYNPLP